MCVLIFMSVCFLAFSVDAESVNSSCPPWFIYNSTSQDCQCYESDNSLNNVICTDDGTLLAFGWCMTFDEKNEATFLGLCPSFSVSGRTVAERRYITLPNNLSELNDYMCGPMNRRGVACSECVDGFAPSATSIGYQCADCTSVSYGVPLYLLIQFVPVTIFYLLILYFQVSLTCAPMTGFILYCQLVALTYKQHDPLRLTLTHQYVFAQRYFGVLASLCGIWNLDFFYYVMPPFCVSRNLKNIHILFFDYFASFYSFGLIAITWVCISIYSRHCQPFVWIWTKLQRCFNLGKQRDSSRTIIDVFSTFLLLSYTKLLLTSIVILQPSFIQNMNGLPREFVTAVDPSIGYFSREHTPFAIVALITFVAGVLLPALLLALYPIRKFRSLLFKCLTGGRIKATLNIFVEKFYNCYRDGVIEGGRDMRSFASLYFFIRILGFFGIALFPTMSLAWLYQVLLFGGCGLLIALVRPYKKAYMNITDSLLLISVALFSLFYLLNLYALQDSPDIYIFSTVVVLTLPLIWFVAYLTTKLFHKKTLPCKKGSICTRSRQQDATDTTNDFELPDRIVHSELYNNEIVHSETSGTSVVTPQHALQVYVSET